MKSFSFFLLAASLVSAAPSGELSQPPAVHVQLEQSGNSFVKATVRNNGPVTLKILRANSIFDTHPIEKVQVSSKANKKIKFEGMRVFYETTENVTDAAYEIIVPGASITTTFDIAKTHDLSQGGGFDVQASGDFIIAHEDNQGPDGRMSYLHFESNLLQADVDGPAAAAMRMATLQKRYHIDGKVSKPHLKAIRASLHNCALMAERAENKARAGPSALLEFLFGANDQETRSLIARYFEIVRKECASLCDGTSNLFDEDHWDACTTEDGKVTVAYALGHEITFCPRFWELPVRAIGCTVNSYDQVTTTIHEMTHLPEIYTKDHTYGLFQKINGKFPTGMALDNARTYELFARGVSYNCQRIGWM